MSVENLLNAEAKTFGGIIKGDHRYSVPLFQRDYSWDEDNWEDLWNDIISNRDADAKHYMGSIVVIPKDKKEYDVIDGQQRLTTLSIIILSAVSLLNDLIEQGLDVDENKERVSLLLDDYIGKKSLSSLSISNKIKLNANNDPFYSSYLIPRRKPTNIRSEIKSNKNLYDCFGFFKSKLNNNFIKNDDVQELISFVEFISDNLLFIRITATDDLSAFLIFETLNDRGLALSVTDLLKNYLFSIVNDDDREDIKNLWDSIIAQISYASFPKFLRHFWMTKHGHIQEKELFKTIKKEISNAHKAFELISELNEVVSIYSALSKPNDTLWEKECKVKWYIRELNLFKVTQCYPLLMISYLKFTTDEFTKILRICSVISFRYLTIAGQNPNAMERRYIDVARSINNSEIKNAKEVFEKLKDIYINDADFISYFEDKIIKTKRSAKLARYIVYLIENHISSRNYDFETDPGTLEHIIPENPSLSWESNFSRDIQDNFIYRIGNFTLLESSKNKVIGNGDFDSKKDSYKTSEYSLSNGFGYNKWNPENLLARQKYLAKQAKAIWSINL